MDIKSICKTIQTTITNYTRVPFPDISGIIMLCSLIKRPGLSVIMSTSKILSSIGQSGIKTDMMEDGQENFLNIYTKAVVTEIFRAMSEDAKIQVCIGPGSATSIGTGGNAGGPVTVVSTLMNYAKGLGILS